MTNTIGRYEIRGELGRGGMATVYRGYDPSFGREVAVKVLPASFLHDPSFRSRFEREARTIAGLEHPAIVPVYDVGEHEGQPYLVMRLMKGSLEEKLREGALSLKEAAALFTRLGGALDRAHAQGIVHRDLKPGNILFDAYGAPYISDFGIVKLSETSEKLSMSGSVMGTPSYMSPEQAHGDKELDGRSDIYTMGVILFEVLTGKTPYQAETPVKMMMKHVMDPIPRILTFNPMLTPGVEAIIDRAMAKDPSMRYATLSEMAEALTALAEGKSTAPTQVVQATLITTPVAKPTTAATEVLPATPATPLPAVAPSPLPGAPEQPVAPAGSKPNPFLWMGGGMVAGAVLLVCSCLGLGLLINSGLISPAPTPRGGAGVSATSTSGGVPPSPPVIAVGGAAATEPPGAAPTDGEESAAEPPGSGGAPETEPQEAPPPTPEPQVPTPEPSVDVADIVPIEEVAAIRTYQLNASFVGLGPAFEDDEELPGGQVFIEAAVIQDPLGYSMLVENPLVPPPNRIEVIRTGDRTFINRGDAWEPVPPEEALAPSDLLAEELEDISRMEGLVFVGTEELNGRRTDHYQGDAEALMSANDADDPERLEVGQIDLWLDTEEGFIVKLVTTGSGTGLNRSQPELQGTANIVIDYSGFNVELFIDPPPLGPNPPP